MGRSRVRALRAVAASIVALTAGAVVLTPTGPAAGAPPPPVSSFRDVDEQNRFVKHLTPSGSLEQELANRDAVPV